jgi:hypothetical protein
MTNNSQIIQFYRERIPTFECTPGCHDCCGPVTASSEEVGRLPAKTDAEHAAALAEYSCPYLGVNSLGAKGCQVYTKRPLICRLFGTTSRMPCPNGKRPAVMIDLEVEQGIHRFLAETRQVLL